MLTSFAYPGFSTEKFYSSVQCLECRVKDAKFVLVIGNLSLKQARSEKKFIYILNVLF